ncbi:hypothetical protein H0178_53940 [Cytobacillus firmus]|nr:hypothetical protein [Cytobacillus firmus]
MNTDKPKFVYPCLRTARSAEYWLRCITAVANGTSASLAALDAAVTASSSGGSRSYTLAACLYQISRKGGLKSSVQPEQK